MRTELDPDLLAFTVFGLYKLKEGEVASAVIHVGTKLGLFAALADAGVVSSGELADATGLHERWVREWLNLLAALELAQHDDGRFALTPEAAVVLADEHHPQYAAGVFGPPISQREIDRTIEAFSTGIGMTWDEHGAETCHFQAAMGAGGQRTHLVPVILDSIDGMSDRLRNGGTVVDIGCGAGVAATAIAEAYPNATVIGMDPSEHAIGAANERAADAGLTNLSFRTGTFDDLAALDDIDRVDLLLTLDVIHDLPRPGAAVRSAKACVADDGVWMVADIKAQSGLEANRRIPVVSLMYAMSILYCMSSAMSEPGGAGLGTLGLTIDVFEEMATAAGFTQFETREFEVDPMNRYYELRP
ncbi:MAG: methyltransferase domain-containing protein [Actinomycetota bacterium]